MELKIAAIAICNCRQKKYIIEISILCLPIVVVCVCACVWKPENKTYNTKNSCDINTRSKEEFDLTEKRNIHKTENMLFENPAVAAKLPFPYNVPPPMQAATAVPNLR